ncbi:uncharacterized protein CLAFUR5_03049 [Fulvia fulva]|uniref:E3 ubiquitin protein ligase n=1 Tax=Passalora fulva TaxID=5499 RepID=A0A9Q8LC16_PASFU|nr:uncharacterized protein CLAFUR5_03049 [Fulvia fulva]KAK4633417.1 hypothetical protein CLAFUR0_03061 [Fulvia fulva]UJO13988.1 hypothetical protein CLAFUR5_03049 [Fulvia fulva]
MATSTASSLTMPPSKRKQSVVEDEQTSNNNMQEDEPNKEHPTAAQAKKKSRVRSQAVKNLKRRRRRDEEDGDYAVDTAEAREQRHLPPGSRSPPIELQDDDPSDSEDESDLDGDAIEEIAAYEEEERARNLRQPRRVQTTRGTTAPRNYFEMNSDEIEDTEQLDEVDEGEDPEDEGLRRSPRAKSAPTRPDSSHLDRFSEASATTRPGTRQSVKVVEFKKSEKEWQAEFDRKQEIMLEQYEELQQANRKLELLEKAFGAYDKQTNEVRRLANINQGDVLVAVSTPAAAVTRPTQTSFKLNKDTAANFKALPAYRPPPPPTARLTEQQRGLKQQTRLLQKEVQNLEAKNQEQGEQIDTLNAKLDDQGVELGDLQHENQGIKRQIAAQRVKNTAQGEDIKGLKDQLEQQGEKVRNLKDQLETERIKSQTLERQMGRQDTETQGLKDRLGTQEQQVASRQASNERLEQQATEIQDFKNQLNSKEATLQNVLGKLDALAEANNSAQAEAARLKRGSNNKKIEDQAAQLSHLHSKWSGATALLKEYGVDDIDGMQNLLAQRSEKLRQLRQDIANKNQEISTLKTEATAKDDKLAKAEAQTTARDVQVTKLKSEVASLDKNNAAFIKQVDKLKKGFGDLGKRCEKRISYLAQSKESLRNHSIALPQPLSATAFTGWNDQKAPADAVAAWRGEN